MSFDESEYVLLGSGRDAEVYQSICPDHIASKHQICARLGLTDQDLVIKKYKSSNKKTRMCEEIYVYKTITNHENIVKFYDYDIDNLYLLFEKANSDLTKYYENNFLRYSSMKQYEEHIKKVVFEIIKGIQYIHDNVMCILR